jgi:hypothetical protein
MSDKDTKACPECKHVFKGNGWDGIDAHWRAQHEDIMPYEKAWPMIKAGTYTASSTKTDNRADIAATFEARSDRLLAGANRFLVLAFVLLIAGIFAVIYAPTITAGDVVSPNSRSLDDRTKQNLDAMVAENAELNKASSELTELNKQCRTVLLNFFDPPTPDFKPVSIDGRPPDDSTLHSVGFDHFPTPDEVADKIVTEIKQPKYSGMKAVGLQLALGGCDGVNLVKSPADFVAYTETLRPKSLTFDSKKQDELRERIRKLSEDVNFRNEVGSRLRSLRVAAAADDAKGPSEASPVDANVTARLIQTSVTRFGLLAVIGFFVALLVSLYRYNIRLAAYYVSRADFFRIFGDVTLNTAETAAIMSALTPGIEFGKMPSTPSAQILELLRSAKRD